MESLFVRALGCAAVASVLLHSQIGRADTVDLGAAKDNTLIEDPKGATSNGIGEGIFSGRVGTFGDGTLRRAVIAFDLSSIPAGSTINSASLTLVLVQTVSGSQTHTLHRLLADWGEEDSDAAGGAGAPAYPGDATWIHTFSPDQFWTTAGGDFDSSISASQTVPAGSGPVTWTDPALAADVQYWLDNPASNFGWLIRGNEDAIFSAKKFASKDNFFEMDRPKLTIDYTPPAPCPADINDDNAVNVADLLSVINSWGPCAGCPADLNGDDVINVADLLTIINSWGVCP